MYVRGASRHVRSSSSCEEKPRGAKRDFTRMSHQRPVKGRPVEHVHPTVGPPPAPLQVIVLDHLNAGRQASLPYFRALFRPAPVVHLYGKLVNTSDTSRQYPVYYAMRDAVLPLCASGDLHADTGFLVIEAGPSHFSLHAVCNAHPWQWLAGILCCGQKTVGFASVSLRDFMSKGEGTSPEVPAYRLWPCAA